ncbi:uncharacterized protein LOC111630889 [Centruroides sculpturatus]|uniref:uncharacterized protein LOC111630889 n=1 Tax=Centruroides sculpturatus TaxID=218467 RepID=UPI000C6E6806|nr:uncharacterized protein LOC111630889 [Centruroides sculpturatus]
MALPKMDLEPVREKLQKFQKRPSCAVGLQNLCHSHPAWACLAKAYLQINIPNIVVSSAKITDQSKPPAILQEVIRCYKVLKEHLSDEEILSSKPDELYNKLVDIYVPKPQNRIAPANILNKSIIKTLSKLRINNNAKTIFWRMHHNCLPTNTWKQNKKLISTDKCPVCQLPETLNHAFLQCEHTKKVWEFLEKFNNIQKPCNENELKWLHNIHNKEVNYAILITAFEAIWRSRNTAYFRKINDITTITKFKFHLQRLLETINNSKKNLNTKKINNWEKTGMIQVSKDENYQITLQIVNDEMLHRNLSI